MSVVTLHGEGLGCAFHDPSELIEAGLFTLSGGDVKNGIEHGVRIGTVGGWFGIESIDLGSIGTDTLTIPVFTESSGEIALRVYDGTPENGELIGDLTYCKPSKWLEFQPETYTLTKKLFGIHTISIAADCKVDIGGLLFGIQGKETAEIPAVSRESIYGDKFVVGEDAITGIGNNVIIGFGEFGFTDFSPTKLIITGRTKLSVNSIDIMFSGESEKRIQCRFEGSDEYVAREFPLDGISGRVKVSFVFLPGCDFDLRSFRFE